MAKHDIVVLNSTSSGFETDLGSNIARIKGDADDLFSVRNSSEVNKFAISSVEDSMIIGGDLTLTGNLSSSLSSTASFGRIDVTNLTGDASLMTNTNQIGHVSSSKQLAARISGAFQHGFELEGENRLISGSATSTGSFTRVFANVYSGDASQMFNTPTNTGTISGSAQIASDISGSFTSGFGYTGTISGSATSTGSFGRLDVLGILNATDASQTTGISDALPSGIFSGSAQLASNISGSFTSGFSVIQDSVHGHGNFISHSAQPTGSVTASLLSKGFFITGIGDIVWSEHSSLPGARAQGAAWGTSTSALAYGGGGGAYPFSTGSTAFWNGSSWNAGTDLPAARSNLRGSGTQDAGILFGGTTNTSQIGIEYNAPSFAYTPGAAHDATGGCGMGVGGTQNAAFMGLGSVSPTYLRKFQSYNGTNFSEEADAPGWTGPDVAPNSMNGAMEGTENSAITWGGHNSPAAETVQEYDGTSWSDAAIRPNATRGMDTGLGTTTAQITTFGKFAIPQEYNSGVWRSLNSTTEAPTVDDLGSSAAAAGTAGTAGVVIGGFAPGTTTQVAQFTYGNPTTASFGHFNMGDYGGFGTTSIISSGSAGARADQTTHGGKLSITDTSELTGLNTEGFISSSAQIAANISGAFTSGFGFGDPIGTTFVNYPSPYNAETHPTASRNIISGSVTSTGSFGRVDNISKIVADGTNATGLSLSAKSVSGSVQLATSISESFTSGFEFDNSISGSVTSTGSFSRLNFNSLSVTDLSGITGHEAGHVSGSSVIASNISSSFQGGFNFAGTISASSDSTLRVQSLNLAGTSTFESTNLVKNWDTSLVRSATFGVNLASAISGAFNAGFGFQGTISGSATSTGSFSRIQSQELFVKEMVGERKPISGSINHDTYISASHKTDSHGRLTIPIFGRGHTVNTQQFTYTGSMESQKYRTRAGQLFVDNFGRLNMTVQTGSMVAVAGTWEQGPSTILTNAGGAATAGTRDAFIMGSPFTPATGNSGSAIYDGIGWTRVSDSTGVHGSQQSNCSIGTVDAALFLRHTGGATTGTNTGKYGSFPNNPGHYTFMEFWDGIGYYRGATGGLVKRSGAGGKVGSVNSHITFGSDSPQCTVGWDGATWKVIGPDSSVSRKLGQGFGSEYSAVYAGGANPGAVSCTEEWNGTSWATATAMPANTALGGGVGTQNAGGTFGSTYWAPGNQKLTQLYNGTSWSEESNTINNNGNASTHGTTGRGVVTNTATTEFWTGAFVTGSADTYNNFQPSANGDGRYLLTKKIPASYSPGCAGGGSTSSEEDFGGGY